MMNLAKPSISSLGEQIAKNPTLSRVLAQAQTTPWRRAIGFAATLNAMALGYHGYRRNNGSVGWTLAWMALGATFWPVGWVFAIGQGFAKPKGWRATAEGQTAFAGWKRRF